MAYRRKTIRRLKPLARKVAKLQGEAETLARRLKTLVLELNESEGELTARRRRDGAIDHSVADCPKCGFIWGSGAPTAQQSACIVREATRSIGDD